MYITGGGPVGAARGRSLVGHLVPRCKSPMKDKSLQSIGNVNVEITANEQP